MQDGVDVHLPSRYASDLIYIQDAALGRPDGLVVPGPFALESPVLEGDYFGAKAALSWRPADGAHGYRVMVSPDPSFESSAADLLVAGTGCSLTDSSPSQTYYWRVEAIGYGGKRFNEGGTATFLTPDTKPLKGIQFLSDCSWIRAQAGAENEVKRDRNYYDKAIEVGGREYPKGLWTHSFNDATPADIVFDLSSGVWRWFSSEAGVDSAASGTVQFQVLLDDRLAAESPVMRAGQAHAFHVDLKGAARLTLRVLNGGDGYTCDHAAWAMARFVAEGASDPF